MSQIVIDNFSVKRGSFTPSPISLTVQKEETFVILGHTGSDETVFLEATSDLFPGNTGGILFDGIDVRDIPPGQRELGLVYQDYGLFPRMKLKENISYGLKVHGYSKKEQDSRTQELMEMLSISHVRDQYPGIPSGGESQRIALTRTLTPASQVLLLDEPFSTLDPATRQSLYQELRRIHRHSGCTITSVTHDFLEARTLTSRATILLEGELKIVTDTPKPINRYSSAGVGGFLGRNQIITMPERQRERGIVQRYISMMRRHFTAN